MIVGIGDRIRAARETYGMTQAELSRRIGISTTAMNDLEQGRTADPRVSHIVAIADVLHVSLDTLVGHVPAATQGTPPTKRSRTRKTAPVT